MDNQGPQCFPLKFDYDSTGTLVTVTRADYKKDRRLIYNNFPFFFCILVEYAFDDKNESLRERPQEFVTFYFFFIYLHFFLETV